MLSTIIESKITIAVLFIISIIMAIMNEFGGIGFYNFYGDHNIILHFLSFIFIILCMVPRFYHKKTALFAASVTLNVIPILINLIKYINYVSFLYIFYRIVKIVFFIIIIKNLIYGTNKKKVITVALCIFYIMEIYFLINDIILYNMPTNLSGYCNCFLFGGFYLYYINNKFTPLININKSINKTVNIKDELLKLKRDYELGKISEEEYQRMRKEALNKM